MKKFKMQFDSSVISLAVGLALMVYTASIAGQIYKAYYVTMQAKPELLTSFAVLMVGATLIFCIFLYLFARVVMAGVSGEAQQKNIHAARLDAACLIYIPVLAVYLYMQKSGAWYYLAAAVICAGFAIFVIYTDRHKLLGRI